MAISTQIETTTVYHVTVWCSHKGCGKGVGFTLPNVTKKCAENSAVAMALHRVNGYVQVGEKYYCYHHIPKGMEWTGEGTLPHNDVDLAPEVYAIGRGV